jgi:hypothetical protein
MRENHQCFFKIIFLFIILISFVFPVYNLIFLTLVTNIHNKTVCNVPSDKTRLYSKLTILFVVKTLAIPFFVITFSNVSIVLAIYNNRNILEKNKKIKQINMNTINKSVVKLPLLEFKLKDNEFAVVYKKSFVKKNWCIKNDSNNNNKPSNNTPSITNSFSNKNASLTKNNYFNWSKKDKSYNSTSQIIKNNESFNRIYARHLMIAKMLVPISSSFVLLQLPYFITWCYYANNLLKSNGLLENPQNQQNIQKQIYYHSILKLSEILNLLYYSLASLLLFSGKMYRKHLYDLFCLKTKSSPVRFQRDYNRNASNKRIQIVRL